MHKAELACTRVQRAAVSGANRRDPDDFPGCFDQHPPLPQLDGDIVDAASRRPRRFAATDTRIRRRNDKPSR